MKRFVVVLLLSYTVLMVSKANQFRRAWCEEVYVVRDGETLQTISERCNAHFILVDNPHILDTDDVVPGTVLMLRSPHPSF